MGDKSAMWPSDKLLWTRVHRGSTSKHVQEESQHGSWLMQVHTDKNTACV